jgi:hypothetical protein
MVTPTKDGTMAKNENVEGQPVNQDERDTESNVQLPVESADQVAPVQPSQRPPSDAQNPE